MSILVGIIGWIRLHRNGNFVKISELHAFFTCVVLAIACDLYLLCRFIKI